jgi:hypothetical protein
MLYSNGCVYVCLLVLRRFMHETDKCAADNRVDTVLWTAEQLSAVSACWIAAKASPTSGVRISICRDPLEEKRYMSTL